MSIDMRPEPSAEEATAAIAEEIRAMMARRRMSGRELARRLDVSPAWVSYRLSGVQEIGVNDLSRIARLLQVHMVDLLPRDERDQVTLRELDSNRGKAMLPAPRKAVTSKLASRHDKMTIGPIGQAGVVSV